MKKPFSMFFPVCGPSLAKRFHPYLFRLPVRRLTGLLALLMLCLPPTTGRAFDLNSLVDDVGKAVKSGAAVIEENVKQVLPGDEKNKTAPNDTTSAGQAVKKPAAVPQKKTVSSKAKTEATAPTAAATVASSTPASSSGGPSPSPAPTAPAVAEPKPASGGSVFAKEPINPAAPPPSVASFTAGDKIYGMLKAAKPWKALLGSSDYLIVYVIIDGKQKTSRTIGLKRPELLARDYVIIDIAPDPAGMTSYADRDIVFPEKDGYKFGPELFTKYLSELSPGKHTFRLEVKAYGDMYASGEFAIAGDDYGSYAGLLAALKDSGNKQQKMPKAGMTDVALQNEMIKVLKNRGWPEIKRLIIVDKDWWLNRASGGDSPIVSRHIEATAAAQDPGGGFYYCHITFQQPKLITGNWGSLEIIKTGDRKIISEENINL